MHLKSLEMIGFKSFADRTKLEFEPGMIAIVGPNGCGKSNVSDAIRWVLGEQRPTALRGTRMQDVIFNGTDMRKPLGLAEVNITFSDCEGTLQTEFNEVTISRRVFRTGEGSYFINRTPCRLRDIHRLFMGTGVGTTSYSVMAQGQIDAILSSKPEDRRAVFEEAAGITKFKADRKEALRKIEQTDANLLRLADVIREVRRQIGSLQRQAGKAQRYKELRDELRRLDLYATRKRLAALDVRLRDMEAESGEVARQIAEYQEAVAEAEQDNGRIHAAILETEHQVGALTESSAQAESRLQHAREMIRVSEQRIAEYRDWSARDAREMAETHQQIASARLQHAELCARQERVATERAAAAAELERSQAAFDAQRQAADTARAALQRARDESLEGERRCARIQNQLAVLEARQRETLLQRERLSSEQGQLAQALEGLVQTRTTLATELETRRETVAGHAERLETLEADRETTASDLSSAQTEASQVQAQLAARRAQLDLLSEQEASHAEFQSGSRLLLDAANPLHLARGTILGPLADRFKVSPEYRPALEAVLRAWIDAVVVHTPADAAAVVAGLLDRGQQASARMVVAAGLPETPATATLDRPRLLDQVTVSADFREAAERLLGQVFLVATLEEVPQPVPAGCTVVTRSGAVFRADGCTELWMPEGQTISPLARRLAIADAHEQVEALASQTGLLRARIESLSQRAATLTAAIADVRRSLEVSRREAAQQEGELQSISRDVERARQRHGVVKAEFELLQLQTKGADDEAAQLAEELRTRLAAREQLVETIATGSATVQELEAQQAASNAELTEHRIRHAHLVQQAEHARAQTEAVDARLGELERQLQGRNAGVQSYDERIAQLTAEIAATSGRLGDMEQQVRSLQEQTEAMRRTRAAKARELERAEAGLAEHRRRLDTARERKARLDLDLAEARMRRQNQLERVQSEYALSADQLVAESDPAWPGGEPPALEDVESRVSQLNASIQEMGPVNLVAIDEYKELEERLTFLKAQEDDLIKSKEQILDLIRMINKKSAEMFRETFEQANQNFQQMFTKLFNGGTASLVLLDEGGDPLECGVDIIARPPGKRPQSVSLLSGGERTMTAVSLLFAIYMIKPSPFCMLDELDAALDDSNIGRFVQALKDFLVQSQFLIITHNQHTIASSDIVYGVTMPERGVSRIVSMRLREIGVRELEIAADAPAGNGESETGPKRRRRGRRSQSGESAESSEALQLPLEPVPAEALPPDAEDADESPSLPDVPTVDTPVQDLKLP